MGKPFISIIIPIYNVEDYLDECLISIANQTDTNFIALLVDDGSKDSSAAIAQSYVDKYPYLFQLHTKLNGGLSDARNFGIELVETEYVMFVDSDDVIDTETIEHISMQLSKTDSDILCFGMTEINETGQHIRDIPPVAGSHNLTNLISSPRLLINALPNACNKVFKTNLFLQNNIRFPKGLWYEDLATTPKLLYVAKSINFSDKFLYHYRTRDGSITQTISPKVLDMLKVLTTLESYFAVTKNQSINSSLQTLKLNMLMKTLVRVGAIDDKAQLQSMLDQIQQFIETNMPATLNIIQTRGQAVYKFTLLLAKFKLNKLLISFIKICLKRGLVRA